MGAASGFARIGLAEGLAALAEATRRGVPIAKYAQLLGHLLCRDCSPRARHFGRRVERVIKTK